MKSNSIIIAAKGEPLIGIGIKDRERNSMGRIDTGRKDMGKNIHGWKRYSKIGTLEKHYIIPYQCHFHSAYL